MNVAIKNNMTSILVSKMLAIVMNLLIHYKDIKKGDFCAFIKEKVRLLIFSQIFYGGNCIYTYSLV